MGKVSKSQAFIEIARAINSGEESKANAMINVVGRSIAADNRSKVINSDVKLRRKEKTMFSGR